MIVAKLMRLLLPDPLLKIRFTSGLSFFPSRSKIYSYRFLMIGSVETSFFNKEETFDSSLCDFAEKNVSILRS